MKNPSRSKKLGLRPEAENPIPQNQLSPAAKKRIKLHRDSPPLKVAGVGGNYKYDGDAETQLTRLFESFGSGDYDFAQYQVNHLINIAPQEPSLTAVNALLAFMRGLDPKDEVESLLGCQMMAASELYLEHGATSEDVMALLGQRETKTTQRYIHNRGSRLEGLAKVIRLFPECSQIALRAAARQKHRSSLNL